MPEDTTSSTPGGGPSTSDSFLKRLFSQRAEVDRRRRRLNALLSGLPVSPDSAAVADHQLGLLLLSMLDRANRKRRASSAASPAPSTSSGSAPLPVPPAGTSGAS